VGFLVVNICEPVLAHLGRAGAAFPCVSTGTLEIPNRGPRGFFKDLTLSLPPRKWFRWDYVPPPIQYAFPQELPLLPRWK